MAGPWQAHGTATGGDPIPRPGCGQWAAGASPRRDEHLCGMGPLSSLRPASTWSRHGTRYRLSGSAVRMQAMALRAQARSVCISLCEKGGGEGGVCSSGCKPNGENRLLSGHLGGCQLPQVACRSSRPENPYTTYGRLCGNPAEHGGMGNAVWARRARQVPASLLLAITRNGAPVYPTRCHSYLIDDIRRGKREGAMDSGAGRGGVGRVCVGSGQWARRLCLSVVLPCQREPTVATTCSWVGRPYRQPTLA
jgi:hypothetical protein